MTPRFSDFFKSFYYSNTYVPAIDLSDEALAKHFLSNENSETANLAQRLISIPEIQEILSAPLTFDLESVMKKNETLSDYGFDILSKKNKANRSIPFYSVLEHEYLKGWIIKAGAARASDKFSIGPTSDLNESSTFNKYDSIFRIEMAQRIERVAKEANISVVVPKKKLVRYTNADGITDVTRKYCILCEKVDVLSVEETREAIKNMDSESQKDLAKKISTIVQKAGLIDTSFHNIRLNAKGVLTFIDTEPVGLMTAKKPGIWNHFFGPRGYSVEKCAKIGLCRLLTENSDILKVNETEKRVAYKGLKPFCDQIKVEYKLAQPKISAWKVGLSLCSLGIVPCINAITSAALTILAKQADSTMTSIKEEFKVKLADKTLEEADQIKQQLYIKIAPSAKKYYALIDGTPFKSY